MRVGRAALACTLVVAAGCEVERRDWQELDSTVYSPAAQRLFLGKPSSSRIVVMQTDPRTARQHYVGTVSLEAVDRVLRLAVDPSRDELWVLTERAASAYGVHDLELRRRVDLAFPAADMALHPSGDLYFVQSGGTQVHRWRQGDAAPEPWVQLSQRYTTAFRSRAAISPDGRYLVSVVGREPQLARIDLVDRRGSLVTTDRAVGFQCFTLHWRHEARRQEGANVLMAIDCGGLGMESAEFSADFSNARVAARE